MNKEVKTRRTRKSGHQSRQSRTKSSLSWERNFYKMAAEVDKLLEMEFADDEPTAIRLAHR